jgi:hypothetical protein
MSFATLSDTIADGGELIRSNNTLVADSVDTLLLPVFGWVQSLQVRSSELNVEWPLIDAAWSENSTAAVEDILGKIAAAGNDETGIEELLFRLVRVISEGLADAGRTLRGNGVQSRSARLLTLPVESHLASWSVQKQSSDAIGLARDAIAEHGSFRLALSFEQQFVADRRQANAFRIAAMVAILASAGWSLAALFALTSNVDIGSTIGRIVVAVSFLTLAGFFTRESSNHRRDANVWRTIQLQLNAFDEYIVPLSQTSREILRLRLGVAIFSGPDLFRQATENRQNKDPGQPASAGDVLAAVWDIAQTLDQFRGTA